jgi:hypothetical protein
MTPLSPSAASSRFPFHFLTNTIITLRHLRESTPLASLRSLRRRTHKTHNPPQLTNTTPNTSMSATFSPIEKSTAFQDTLDQYPIDIAVSGVSENGRADSNDTTTRGRKDTFDPTENSYSAQSPCLSQESIKSTLTRPLQAHLPSSSQAHLLDTSRELSEEKDFAATLNVTTYVIRTPAPSITSRPLHRQRLQRLWLHWFTAYRILIGLTFIVNATVLVFLATQKRPHRRLSLPGPLIATAANIFVAVIVRQEDLINASFSLVAKTPMSLPLWARKIIADFHHYGGLHVGCSVSALLWYVLFVYFNTSFFVDEVKKGSASGWMYADIVTCWVFVVAILGVCVTALPKLRVKFHNTFEHTHRFGGWIALLVLWLNAGVSIHNDGSPPMYKNAAVWLLAATTFFIILPWTRISRVPITAEAVSSREVKLTFPYKNMPYTSTTRFSLSPLMEWHAFATIPSSDSTSAYIVVSQAGDWTKTIIANPPSHIWMRKPAAKNFLSFAPLFSSLLLVATGAGIGPLLSLLSSPVIAQMRSDGKQVRVMWCVYAPEAPHWQFVQDIIRNVDPMPKIFDSREGRPDLEFETQYMKEVCGIEAVMVVSNAAVTRGVVEGIKVKGGAAYGAVFDS